MGKRENRLAVIRADGSALTTSGETVQTLFLRTLNMNLDDYSDLVFTPAEARRISAHIAKLRTGSTAVVPLICQGPLCPFADRCPLQQLGKSPVGRACHPPGTMIQTVNRGQVPIEDLEEEKDRVAVFHSKCSYVSQHEYNTKGGQHFQLGSREYDGEMIRIKTPYGYQDCTKDHIAMARWNESAFGLFAVYLMRRGNFWRIGKTHLFSKGKGEKSQGKQYSNFLARINTEDADAAWLLGTYQTNTEAMLAEEEFSIIFSVSKACFLARPNAKTKWDGLYKWVTQEQLDAHHKKIAPPPCMIAANLERLGLSIDYPIYDKQAKTWLLLGSTSRLMQIRACNLVSKYMDVATTAGPEMEERKRHGRKPNKVPIEVERYYYKGPVYSLNVEKHHTYVANNIITHNCLLEVQMLKHYLFQYMNEYEIDPESFTELSYCNELAEIEVYLWRINNNLAKAEYAELMIDQDMGADRHGNPITQKQISPLVVVKDKLLSRKSKIIKLMVGDRQEKYKKEAALKQRNEKDTSSIQAAARRKIEDLKRKLDGMEVQSSEDSDILTPDAIMNASEEE